MRLSIHRSVIDWAIKRARADYDQVISKHQWLGNVDEPAAHPTLNQLEKFARDVNVPVGFLFLAEPPQEKLPIPDYRTMAGAADRAPSPDLLDTVFLCQNRQEWFRQYALRHELEAPRYVGSINPGSDVADAAGRIRDELQFDLEDRAEAKSWTEALSRLARQADESGVLVMVNGIVGNNPHRRLNPEEFRGFALSDNLAPLIFVNAADTKAAQIFTIIHELAHVWAGRSALTDSSPADRPSEQLERWCDEVAAEVLVPAKDFERRIRPWEPIEDSISRLARFYKVSTLVILRRMFDVGRLERGAFWKHYNEELGRLREIVRENKGGNFYATQNVRVSQRFARALIESTLRGETLYGEAFRLLSIRKAETFTEYAQMLGVR